MCAPDVALRRRRPPIGGRRRRAFGLLAALLAGCASASAFPPAPTLEALPARSDEACGEIDLRDIGVVEVAIAIDTSHSTLAPSGADIDSDGRIGEVRRSLITDPDDSLLTAQVLGVKSLLRSAGAPAARFAIVTFSGRGVEPWEPTPLRTVLPQDALLVAQLTADPEALDAALQRVLARGSRGSTNLAAGMRQALRGLADAAPDSRRMVLLLSESPTPLLIAPNSGFLRSDPSLEHAARDAIERGVVFHTFGLGRAAAAEPPHILSRIAGATGGAYRAVEDPARLHCELLAALLPPSSTEGAAGLRSP